MKRPRFLFVMATFIVPGILAYLSFSMGLANQMHNSGISNGWARGIAGLVALVIAIGVYAAASSRRDYPVDSWGWVKSLMNRVHTANRTRILCRCHTTTRIQGKALGCQAALDVKIALDYLNVYIRAIISEIRLERQFGYKELFEFLAVLKGLDGSVNPTFATGIWFSAFFGRPPAKTPKKPGLKWQ